MRDKTCLLSFLIACALPAAGYQATAGAAAAQHVTGDFGEDGFASIPVEPDDPGVRRETPRPTTLPTPPAEPAVTPTEPEPVEPSPYLLGDWGGNRTKLQDHGITVDGYLTLDLAKNFRGGWTRRVRASTTSSSSP